MVARFEPENHVDVIVDGYRRSGATQPLVVVGSAPYADEYTERVHALGRRPGALPRRRLGPGAAGPAVRQLRSPTCTGTRSAAPTRRCCAPWAPARPTIAFDVDFNREVLGGGRRVLLRRRRRRPAAWTRAEADTSGIAAAGQAGPRAARRCYDWDDVADRLRGAVLARLARSRGDPVATPRGPTGVSSVPAGASDAPSTPAERQPIAGRSSHRAATIGAADPATPRSQPRQRPLGTRCAGWRPRRRAPRGPRPTRAS